MSLSDSALVTLAQVKSFLRIDGNSDDVLLQILAEAATRKAEDYCARKFVNAAVTEQHIGDGTSILRLNYQPVNSITSVNQKKVDAFTGDGVTLVYTLSSASGTGHLVYVNGVLKTVTTHYAISGAALTFTSAGLPADDAEIVVRYSVPVTHASYEEFLSIGRLKGTWSENYIYEVVYSAGYGADRSTVLPLIPDAILGVLSAVAEWYENRLSAKSVSISGVGSANYGDEMDLPASAKARLSSLRARVL